MLVLSAPDNRLAKLAEIVGTQTIIPAAIEMVDIAGLVAEPAKAKVWETNFWPMFVKLMLLFMLFVLKMKIYTTWAGSIQSTMQKSF